jgi:hypothetical protein
MGQVIGRLPGNSGGERTAAENAAGFTLECPVDARPANTVQPSWAGLPGAEASTDPV